MYSLLNGQNLLTEAKVSFILRIRRIQSVFCKPGKKLYCVLLYNQDLILIIFHCVWLKDGPFKKMVYEIVRYLLYNTCMAQGCWLIKSHAVVCLGFLQVYS